ncbi:MAG: cupredoxin domain-containing protein [Proteobacteria bacterium]|nr:cupredoxin domain-containing protein [Pseudomonadota bacterium]MBI3499926.1 cupredoxin domain-containing protein [Pseudomonadota bacterium]
MLKLWFSALAVLVIVLGGVAASADEPVFMLTIKNHQFEPTEIIIPADTKVKLLVKNADATPEEFDSKDLRREKVIPAGQEGTIFIGPLKAGTYNFIGEFNPATAKGRVVVK